MKALKRRQFLNNALGYGGVEVEQEMGIMDQMDIIEAGSISPATQKVIPLPKDGPLRIRLIDFVVLTEGRPGDAENEIEVMLSLKIGKGGHAEGVATAGNQSALALLGNTRGNRLVVAIGEYLGRDTLDLPSLIGEENHAVGGDVP